MAKCINENKIFIYQKEGKCHQQNVIQKKQAQAEMIYDSICTKHRCRHTLIYMAKSHEREVVLGGGLMVWGTSVMGKGALGSY